MKTGGTCLTYPVACVKTSLLKALNLLILPNPICPWVTDTGVSAESREEELEAGCSQRAEWLQRSGLLIIRTGAQEERVYWKSSFNHVCVTKNHLSHNTHRGGDPSLNWAYPQCTGLLYPGSERMRPDKWQKERMEIWVGLGLGERDGERESRVGVSFPKQPFLWEREEEEGGGRWVGHSPQIFALREERWGRNVCVHRDWRFNDFFTGLYKRTKIIQHSSPHDITSIITVLQMFKNKKNTKNPKTSKNQTWWNICITHENSIVSSRLKWSKTRNTSWPKEVSNFSTLSLFCFSFSFLLEKKIFSLVYTNPVAGSLVINVMTLVSQIIAQACNFYSCHNDLTIKCIIPLKKQK